MTDAGPIGQDDAIRNYACLICKTGECRTQADYVNFFRDFKEIELNGQVFRTGTVARVPAASCQDA